MAERTRVPPAEPQPGDFRPPRLEPSEWSFTANLTDLEHPLYSLAAPVDITIEVLHDENIVSDEHVHMYGTAATVDDALDVKRRALVNNCD